MIFFICLIINTSGSKPIISLTNGDSNNGVYIHEAVLKDDMSFGPQEYIVDMEENIYVHDINTSNDSHIINRIIKFDSTGKQQFILDKKSVPSINDIWFGPITVDPLTNDLIISSSGTIGSTPKNGKIINKSDINLFFLRFKSNGKLAEIIDIKDKGIQGGFLMYDYEGNYYCKNVDGVFKINKDFKTITYIPKREAGIQGYSQWSGWVSIGSANEYTLTNKEEGKYILKIENKKTKEMITFVFYDPPHYGWGGFIEGKDKLGNIYLNTLSLSFIRVHPMNKEISTVYLSELGIPCGEGDTRHSIMISPNGYVYISLLVRNSLNKLLYNIYRITPQNFNVKEKVNWGEK